ncbi:MAG: LacI family DNA-binding transcriptional regulator [Spirochaetaceae bacterium]
MATIADIARLTGLSMTTVSRYLNGHPYVSQEAADIIREAIAELGYTPNSTAVALRQGRTHRIALIVPTTAHSFYAALLAGAGDGARGHGYDLVVRQSPRVSEDTALELGHMLETRLIDGAIVAAEIPAEAVAPLADTAAPLVTCDQVLQDVPFSGVYTDHYASAQEVLVHLSETGRRDIVVIISSEPHGSSVLRRSAAEDFLRETGGGACVSFVVEDDDDSVTSGVGLGERLLSRVPPPDAVFTGADQLAAGVLIAAERHGVRVPAELAIVGFDDQSLSQTLGLTSVYQPTREMGRTAVDMLVKRIEGVAQGRNGVVERVALSHELRRRRTS